MSLLCPNDKRPLHRVRASSPRTTHFICSWCRGIYCGENGVLVACAHPAEHVFSLYEESAPVFLVAGVVAPGPASRGLV